MNVIYGEPSSRSSRAREFFVLSIQRLHASRLPLATLLSPFQGEILAVE